MRFALLVATAAGSAPDEPVLAPGPQHLEDAAQNLERRLAAADASLVAISRIHNILAEAAIASGAQPPPCDDPSWRALAPRTPPLGDAHRDAAQAARAQLARVQRIAKSPTVQTLAVTLLVDRLDTLDARVTRHGEGAGELRAWQATHVTRWLARCAAPLQAGPGQGEPVAPDHPVVVIAIGGGWLCPQRVPADGRAVVVEGGAACIDTGDRCGCTPAVQAPAAVLAAE